MCLNSPTLPGNLAVFVYGQWTEADIRCCYHVFVCCVVRRSSLVSCDSTNNLWSSERVFRRCLLSFECTMPLLERIITLLPWCSSVSLQSGNGVGLFLQCLIVFGCQYQCNWLPGKTRLQMTYYVSSGTLNPTHSLTRPSLWDGRALWSYGEL